MADNPVTKLESLAGTEKTYLAVQVRTNNDIYGDWHVLHLQGGGGEEGNRPYGVATNVKVKSSLAKWIRDEVPHNLTSLADDSQATYISARVRVSDDGDRIQFQIPGPSHNRPYGAAFSIDTSVYDMKPLRTWILANI